MRQDKWGSALDAGSFLAVNGVKLDIALLSAVLQQSHVCVSLGETSRGSPRVELSSAQTRAALCLELARGEGPMLSSLGRRASTSAATASKCYSRALGQSVDMSCCARGEAGAVPGRPVPPQACRSPRACRCQALSSRLPLLRRAASSRSLLSSVMTSNLIGSYGLAILSGKIPTQIYTV